MEGRCAVVTGAARGIGEAIGSRLAQDGWAVAFVDRSPTVRETVDRLGVTVAAERLVAIVADVSQPAQAAAAVDEAADHLGRVDALVNNAGIGGPRLPLVETPPEELRRVLEVNLLGAMLVAAACARRMVTQGSGGAIVNVGSIYGQRGVALGAAYSASKGGIALLTHSLALELAPHGIRVNTVAPGPIVTQMHWDDLRAEAAELGVTVDEVAERVRAQVPLGRHGTGQDVAGAVAWLLGDDASYVTGQTVGVDGGWLLT